MFILKKLLSHLFFPVPLCAELLIAGLVLGSFTKWKKSGRILIVAGTALLLLFGYGWFPGIFLPLLERQYSPLGYRESPGRDAELGALTGPSTFAQCFIAVLGQSMSGDTNLPSNIRLNEVMTQRMVEAVRLQRLMPGSSLLVSISDDTPSREEKERVVHEFLAIFGMQTNSLMLCSGARDTADEIQWFKEVAGTNQVFLVSCASHLPRAMVLARKYGLNAVPSPSGYAIGTKRESPFDPLSLFPSARNVSNSERGIYEYLGLAWESLRK